MNMLTGISGFRFGMDRTVRTDQMRKVRVLAKKLSPGPESLARPILNHSRARIIDLGIGVFLPRVLGTTFVSK